MSLLGDMLSNAESVEFDCDDLTFHLTQANAIVGPGLQLRDISLYKDFYVAEEQRVQFRIELFNAFNHVNFGNLSTGFGSASFGCIRSAGDARQVQFGLRYDL